MLAAVARHKEKVSAPFFAVTVELVMLPAMLTKLAELLSPVRVMKLA